MVTHSVRTTALLVALVAASSIFVASAAAAPALDKTFGKGGFASPSVFPHRKGLQTARGVAIQPDGKVVVPMTLSTAHGHRARRPVIRLNRNGTRDKTYGAKGVAWVRASGAPYITLRGAKSYPAGETLIWGEYFFTEWGQANGFFVSRLSAQGTVDKRFGNRGARRFSLAIPNNDTELIDVSPASDGGVIVTTQRYSLSSSRETLVITRLSPDGSIDRSFGANGAKVIPIDERQYMGGFAVGRDAAYMMLVANKSCSVRRFDLAASGAQDLSYGDGGDAAIGLIDPKAKQSCGVGISASESGSVFIYGSYFIDVEGYDAFVARLQPNGALDNGFGGTGIVKINSMENAYAAAAVPGGGVLVGGSCGMLKGCMAALDPSGAPTLGFGKSGVLDFGDWVGTTHLTASGTSAAAVLLYEDSDEFPLTRILKLSL